MSEGYWKSKEAGICFRCQGRPIRPGRSTCALCAEHLRVRQQQRVAEARQKGLCVRCFAQPRMASSIVCSRCRARAQPAIQRSREKQRLKRLVQRWTARFAACSVDEQRALLVALVQVAWGERS